jgi:hypothetical protein
MSLRKIVRMAALGMAVLPATLLPAAAQDMHAMTHSSFTLGLLEIPFLAVAIGYSLRTAGALKGGVFGRGMMLMAGGLVVMALGHVIMMLEMYFGINVLTLLFGSVLGSVLWVVALVLSWGLMGVGFHSIYSASKA